MEQLEREAPSPVQPEKQPETLFVNPDKRKRRQKVISWTIVGVILVVGLASWFFDLHGRAYRWYNSTSVTIKIKDDADVAVPNARVVLQGIQETTDEQGKVTLSNVQAGDYTMVVSADDFNDLEAPVSLTRGENELKVYTLVRSPLNVYDLTILVKDSISNAVVDDVQIKITPGDKRQRTTSEGTTLIENALEEVEYGLTFEKSGYSTQERSFTYKDGVIDSADFNDNILTVQLYPTDSTVYVSNADGKRKLYATPLDSAVSKEATRIFASDTDGEDYAPIKAPQGDWVVFVSSRDGIQTNYGRKGGRLYIGNLKTGEVIKVGDELEPQNVMWSPAGTYLYYEGYTDPELSTYVRQVYTLADARHTIIGEASSAVAFFHKAPQLMYTIPSGDNYQIKRLNVDNGERTLVHEQNRYIFGLTISQDDAILSYETIDSGGKPVTVERTLASGQEQTKVRTYESRQYVQDPNGTDRLFIESRDGKSDLYLLDASGKETRLTTLGVLVGQPQWSESGRYCIFSIRREGESALYVISRSGGTPVKITDSYNESSNNF